MSVPGRSHRGQGEAHRVGAVLLDDLDGIDHVALGLRHLLAVGVAHQRVDVDVPEGHVSVFVSAHEVAIHHDHARHPEEQDVEASNEQRRRIKRIQVGRRIGPAQRRARQQSRRKPRVEHVVILLQRAAALALRRRLTRNDDLAAGLAVPRGNAMSPPQLPRDAPVVNVAHPLEVRLGVHSRVRT